MLYLFIFATIIRIITENKLSMKIFVLLSRIPWPLEKGDKLRAYNQIKQLSVRHEIILCALNADAKADKQLAFRALQPYCRSINFIDLPVQGIITNVLKSLLNGNPLQTGYFYNSNAAKKINKLIAHHQPDILYGQLLRIAEYIRRLEVPKVLDFQDVLSKGMHRRQQVSSCLLKPFFRLEYLRLLRYETALVNNFDLTTIISQPDRMLIPHPKNNEILIVPNGVDYAFFTPMPAEKKIDVVFTGNMAYPPNIYAAEFLVFEIMPIVWKSLPKAKLLLAGATPDKRVRNLTSDRVHVSGWMDDIRMAYAESKVFVAPMRIGTGLQNKLLEAMAMRLPCVTTVLANAALKGENGTNILVGETAVELAEEIIYLLQNQEQANQLAQNGYMFVHANYDWAASIVELEKQMKEIIDQRNMNNK